MRLELPRKIDTEKWLSRMGVKGYPDAGLLMKMSDAESKIFAVAMPQGIYCIRPVEIVTPVGNAIKKHLADCQEVVIMGVTLGTMVDDMIRTSQIRDMAEAVIIDSGASVLVEQLCDAMMESIKEETKLYLTGRYSPGYGDYPVKLQSELIWLMDAHRKIGLTVNESHIMIPRKSVTAVIGAADHPVKGYLATCEECELKTHCDLRKEGRNCAGF